MPAEEEEEFSSFPADGDAPADDDDDEEEENDDDLPLLSVLNVVVDHVMTPPTPLEPLEYEKLSSNYDHKETTKNLRVPVLRIFGPIVRRRRRRQRQRGSAVVSEPMQSGCLFVHGAFPYLLARPVVAGPDGSLHHGSHSRRASSSGSSSSGHVDWDSLEEVQRVVPQLQSALEAALQASVAENKKDNTTSASNNNTTRPPPPRSNCGCFLRRISVVMGRGFYTYCPGPPAPFLRVEYYDPKVRWRVKMMLERGLDLPLSYHPDPQQYQSTLSTEEEEQEDNHDAGRRRRRISRINDEDDRLGRDSLSFHCYEAHIPYTMQFFKDWNLAGMSYVHIREGRFRQPLPRGIRHGSSSSVKKAARWSEEALFLEGNTLERYGWRCSSGAATSRSAAAVARSEREEDANAIAFLQQSSSSPETSHQDSQDSSSNVVLASSALKEEEKAKDAFWTRKETSCDVEIDASVEEILNVKSVMTSLPQDEEERLQLHWRAVPSLREVWLDERRRMAKLLQPKDDFLGQMAGNQDKTTPQDEKGEQTPPFTLNVKKGASIPGARLAAKGMRRLFGVSDGLETEFRRAMRQIIERHANAVARVDCVLNKRASLRHAKPSHQALFHTPSPTSASPPDSGRIQSQTSVSSLDEAVAALGALGSQFAHQNGDFAMTDFQIESIVASCSQQTPGTDSSPTQSQRAKSDSPFSQGCLTQDPMEFSQRVERGECILEEDAEDATERINPETLTPFEDDDDGYFDEEDNMTERDLEQTLSILATQPYLTDARPPDNEQPGPDNDSFMTAESVDRDQTTIEYESDDTADLLEGRFDMERVTTGVQTRSANETAADPVQDSDQTQTIAAKELQFSSLSGAIAALEKIDSPPTAVDTVAQNASGSISGHYLYPLVPQGSSASWLSLVSAYESLRDSYGMFKCNNWYEQLLESEAQFLEPVKKAPSKWEVEKWIIKSKRKSGHEQKLHPSKKQKKNGSTSRGRLAACELHIDDNSRKLTAVPESISNQWQLNSKDPVCSIGNMQAIEEVEWKMSQQALSLSLSQSEASPKGQEEVDTPTVLDTATPPSATPGRTAGSFTLLSGSGTASDSPLGFHALNGIGQQGGRIYVEGGGGLKSKTRQSQPLRSASESPARKRDRTLQDKDSTESCSISTPLTVMSIEIHVQCRTGRAGINDAKEIAMKPNSEKDMIYSVVYVYGRDPGGGGAIEILERGCLLVPNESDKVLSESTDARNTYAARMRSSLPGSNLGIASRLSVETVRDEKHLLRRLASIVQWKDPDMLLSWDTQGGGLGYIIERGAMIDKGRTNDSTEDSLGIDMTRLLGRTPGANKTEGDEKVRIFDQRSEIDANLPQDRRELGGSKDTLEWRGSGLGSEWDDRVGPGSAAASIPGRLIFAGWKIVAEEVKHPNASYLPAMVSTVLNKRIPHHDDLLLTRWYGMDGGRQRWRVLHYRLTQAMACLLMFDALDVIGRAGEAARLSGVEFSQSFPGIRGSQYKVEGVLLRALQSLRSDERGAKRGRQTITLTGEQRQLGIDHSSSLSNESKSQTQSPWKLRRQMEKSKDGSQKMSECVGGRNYFFFSPSLQDCNRQEALECQALTLEPKSGCLQDPVVVCDFTALYPSLVIAYNLCYSTCAGKLDYHSTRREMGLEGKTTGWLGPFRYAESRTATVLKHHMKSIQICGGEEDSEGSDNQHLRDRAYIAPTGTIYVSEDILKGVLPQVLDELLSTRAMLKKASKQYKKLVPDLAPSVLRQLEARQLALKYVANVTYGYTSATFSGRCAMPLLADTIVECGRRTLSNAINLANAWGRESGGRWHGATVIYGDTDSVFVKLPGRSVREAFEFGETFCRAVTASNPPPVALKLEKVYHGSMMQTKKKYCGMKYESPDQKKPTFEAKGIETVRRDQCALTQKVLRNALTTLFRSGIDAVKAYLYRQWHLILAGRLSVSNFILTGRVRSRYRGGRVGPVQAVLARRLAEADPGRVVRHKERIAYVIVATPGLTFRLRDCVLTPLELMEQWDAYTIHSAYYITKHVNAALQRCLGLPPHRADVNAWYESCPKPRRRIHYWPVTRSGNNVMISSYFGSDICSLCGKKCHARGRARAVVCSDCQRDPAKASIAALTRLNRTQEEAQNIARVCSECNGCFEDTGTFATLKAGNGATKTLGKGKSSQGLLTPLANCTCIDCPNTFKRHQLREIELEAVSVCKALDLL